MRAPVFLFPGQGVQAVGMGARHYRDDEAYRSIVDESAAALAPLIGVDLAELIYGEPADPALLDKTHVAQPALFVTEYALASSLIASGLRPAFMMGHSVGEYVAACLAGVFDLPDALALIAARGLAMSRAPRGSMLSILAPREGIVPLLPDGVDIAAVNAPEITVVAGPTGAIEQLATDLADRHIRARLLRTSHAYHSSAMDGVLDVFTKAFDGVTLRPPRERFVSTLTGTEAGGEVAEVEHWVRQLREPVRFADGVATLVRLGADAWIEVGPGRSAQGFVEEHPDVGIDDPVVGALDMDVVGLLVGGRA
jgi:acyl transferase domain-containing protein